MAQWVRRPSPGRKICGVSRLRSLNATVPVVDAALEEDVQGVAVSSYQAGHIEYFEYLVEWHCCIEAVQARGVPMKSEFQVTNDPYARLWPSRKTRH